MSKNQLPLNRIKIEAEYLSRIKKYPDQVFIAHKDSVQEGFEYFASDEYLKKHSSVSPGILNRFRLLGPKNIPKMLSILVKNVSSIIRGKKQCFTDLEPYLIELEQTGRLDRQNSKYIESFPNKGLWKELSEYAWLNWKVILGFTKLPIQLIFKEKGVLFNYAIVCIQEMDRKKIDLAFNDSHRSGKEVVDLVKLSKRFGDKILLEDADLHIRYLEKVSLLGKNGSGKSTLIKMIINELHEEVSPENLDYRLDKGEVKIGSKVKVGYLQQEVDFNPDDTLKIITYKQHKLGVELLIKCLQQYQNLRANAFYKSDCANKNYLSPGLTHYITGRYWLKRNHKVRKYQ